MASVYMHTIDGYPAFFSDDQLYYAGHGCALRDLLVPSLQIIREQQVQTRWYRRHVLKIADEAALTYGYLRFTK